MCMRVDFYKTSTKKKKKIETVTKKKRVEAITAAATITIVSEQNGVV